MFVIRKRLYAHPVHCDSIVHKTLTVNDKILVKLFKCGEFNWMFCIVVNVLHVLLKFYEQWSHVVFLAILVILDHSIVFRMIIPEVVFIQLSSWEWAHSCLKRVEDSNKRIIEEIVRQIVYLPELNEDARSEKY